MARNSHVKSSVAGAGKNANQGLSRVSKRDPNTNLQGWALNVYRVLGIIQDEVLAMLHEASVRRNTKSEAKRLYDEAVAAKDKAADDYAEDANMMTAECLKHAAAKVDAARRALTEIEDGHANETRAIRGWNGWLARFGAEVRKRGEHVDPVTKTTVPGETHQERKERTKKALIGLSGVTSTKVQSEQPLALPDIDILAMATGTPAEVLKKQLCDSHGVPIFKGMPEDMPSFLTSVAENAETKVEVREFLKAAGFGS